MAYPYLRVLPAQERGILTQSASFNYVDLAETLKIDELTEKGLSSHKEGKFVEAIDLFSQALPFCQATNYNHATILQYRANSHLQLRDYSNVLKDVKNSITLKNNSMEIHVLAGKAFAALGRYRDAFNEYIRAYRSVVLLERNRIVEVLFELTSLFSRLPENNHLRELTMLYVYGQRNMWAKVCHQHVKNREWKEAYIAFLQFKNDPQNTEMVSIKLDLKPFCCIKDIRSNPWTAEIILYLLQCGSDKTELSIEDGDTYLHAAVRIALNAGFPKLLQYLILRESESAVLSRPIIDSHGNTLLHTATKERNINKTDRNKIMTLVLEFGVDPHARNDGGRSAISNLSDDKSKDLIRKFYKTKEKEQTKVGNDRAVSDKSRQDNSRRDNKKRNKKNKKARENVSTCEECQEIYDGAIIKLQESTMDGLTLQIKLFNIDHSNEKHSGLVQGALKHFVEYIGKLSEADIHKCMENLCKEKYVMIIESLAENRQWIPLDVILRRCQSLLDAKTVKDVSSKFSLDSYLGSISQTDEDENIRIINNLITYGWSLGKDHGQSFMKTVIDLKQYKLANMLLNHGMDCSMLSVYEGDTPIHAAIQIALQGKQPSVLKVLLKRYKSDKVLYAYLDPEQVDLNGDSVYKLLETYDTDLVPQLTQILNEIGDSSSERNRQMNITESNSISKLQTASATKVAHKQSLKYQSLKPLSEQQEEIRSRIKKLITSIKSKSEKKIQCTKLDERDVHSDNELSKNAQERNAKKTLEDIAISACFASKGDELFDNGTESDELQENTEDFSDLPPLETDEEINEEANQILNIDEPMPKCTDDDKISDIENDRSDADLKSAFENLTWEVEYTDKVRKQLTSKRIDQHMRNRVLRIIRRLADGDWQNSFCKELKTGSDAFDLFEAKLSDGSRIIWEKAINYSPRYNDYTVSCSDTSTENTSDVHGYKIYTEVIRVWDIVIDHDKIKRSVEKIKDAHRRGAHCLIQRNLKGLPSNKGCRKKNEIKYPLLFSQTDSKGDPSFENQVQQFFPPASPFKKEYNILKFYTWDGAFERHVLHGSNGTIEFPFKVTEKEDTVIRINDKGPILLLGRSGTGKTTCCLFRLWNEYKKHMPEAVENPGEHQENQTKEQHENRNDNMVDEKTFSNLNQLFLTKNYVLVTEVVKTFSGFLESNEAIKNKCADELHKNIPNSFKDLKDESFPLFLTSRQFLCKLDASIGNNFFSRKEDGSLKYPVEGWVDDERFTTALDVLDFDSADEDVDETDDFETDIREERQDNIRREVTYDVFESDIWPLLVRKTSERKYHSSLVWTEIMSFIKGSYESLYTSCGYISKEKYIEIGMKRAPNFAGDREEVYTLFEIYERVKKQNRMFDETDVVFDIFKRLDGLDTCPIKLHQIYIDEAQDFTQAELFLVIRLCQNPNNMFLTGDTAQSIMRGISFRFEDLKSLFYHIRQELEERKRGEQLSKHTDQTVYVPKKVHKLIYNYRSHSGIVSLASSILDILGYFFRESFDLLEPDQGLLPGPKPILLESCTFSDLAVLLRGNKRKTSSIEFGAHQVILVYDEEARESLPEELSCGIVLTIYEAKGLEFDDVLLYNFFKESQASEEWRVVTQYLNELSTTDKQTMYQQNVTSVVVDQDVLSLQNRPRPLHFDPNQHKILGSELKILYTALTRARVNVWIFDEDLEKRKPIFEYFEARNLVNSVRINDFIDESIEETIFVEKCTDEDWNYQGDYFMKKRLCSVAAKCFLRGGYQYKQLLAQGHENALSASRKRYNASESKQMKAEFLFAAEMYLKCEHFLDAAKCLKNAKELELATALYDKLGLYEKAASVCRRHKQYTKSSKFNERSCNYNKAVGVLFENYLYGRAFDVFESCRIREEEMKQTGYTFSEHQSVNSSKASFTAEKIYKRAAEEFHKLDKKEELYKAVNRFPLQNDRIEFYKSNGYISDAVRELENTGDVSNAVDLFLMHGKFQDAKDIAEKNKNDRELGKCLLIMSRHSILNQIMRKGEIDYERKTKPLVEVDILEENLEKALSLFEKLKDRNSAGQVKLLQAQLIDDVKYVFSAAEDFKADLSNPNKEGYLECCVVLIPYLHNSEQFLHFLLKGVDFLFDVCKNILMSNHKTCQFYGIYLVSREGKASSVANPRTNPLCAKMLQKIRYSHDVEVKLLDKDIHQIVKNLLDSCTPWTEFLKDSLLRQRASILEDIKYTKDGEDTYSDNWVHVADNKVQQLIRTYVLLTNYEFFINKAEYVLEDYKRNGGKNAMSIKEKINSCNFLIKANESYAACKFLLKDFVQQPQHPLFLTDNTIFEKAGRNKLFCKQMRKYLSWRFTDPYRYLTDSMPDQAVRKFQSNLRERVLQKRIRDPACELLRIEFYSTLAFFLIAKIESKEEIEFTFYLPNNYIALLRFMESTVYQKERFSILQIISNWKPTEDSDLLDCISSFASVITSQMEKQILEIHEKENRIMLLERLVILNNTMICNLGKCVSYHCSESLVNSAQSIQKSLVFLKAKTSNATTMETQQFKSIKDVAEQLQCLLKNRHLGEIIQSIKWGPQQFRTSNASQIDIDKMSTEVFTDIQSERKTTAVSLKRNEIDNNESKKEKNYDARVNTNPSDWPDLVASSNKTEMNKRESSSVINDKANENNTEDDNIKAFTVPSIEVFINEILTNHHECGICGVPFVECENINTYDVTVEPNTSHVEEYYNQGNQIKDSAINNDVSKGKQEHEKEETHLNNIKIFKMFETDYSEYYKPVIYKVNELLQSSKFNMFDENYISKHFDTYRDEIQRMRTNNDKLQTNIIEALRERKWDSERGHLQDIVQILQKDYDLVQPYVISVTDELSQGRYFNALDMRGNAAFTEKDDPENDFETVALEPVKRKNKDRTSKERRDKKKQHGKKKLYYC